ncbi:Cystinosin [Fasciola gigantica]|uniref:Cystinosin n=1 Tax=Fasciola gigantica TaxID=46835 RepID=A0A504YL31_FASGI|nr:Cystinosin [Fasciola gigantica]
MRFLWLDVLQNILGWCYFVSWTLSFYPQVWLNWRRKSVIGFSFDLLTFNIVGYVAYSVYNLGLYCSPAMKYQYFSLNPDGVLPVMLNDVFFALHALLVCCFLLIQTLIYERGDQRVSNTCRAIVGLVAIYCVGFAMACGQNLTTWLAFLYQLSYVKVLVTFLKYVPQVSLEFVLINNLYWITSQMC